MENVYYSLLYTLFVYSALLLTRACIVHYIGNRVPLKARPLSSLSVFVYWLQVVLQMASLFEVPATLRAGVRFLPSVDQFVPLQIIVIQKALPAVRAPFSPLCHLR